MTKINVELSDEAKALVDREVAEGGYKSTSEYFEDMVRRREEKRRAKSELEKKLVAGLASGSKPLTTSEWQEMRREVLARLNASKARP